ncbi:hypothetical protein [Alloalcanivorax xenomutans]|uniref:hypothetical protein n=1 Tax=Alloalcanivorax xenomutans TaxID=1094342 RepID=UPI003BA86B1E
MKACIHLDDRNLDGATAEITRAAVSGAQAALEGRPTPQLEERLAGMAQLCTSLGLVDQLNATYRGRLLIEAAVHARHGRPFLLTETQQWLAGFGPDPDFSSSPVVAVRR